MGTISAADALLLLTDKQRKFAMEYVEDFDSTRASLAAGYAPHSAYRMGIRARKNPKVKAAIEALCEEAIEDQKAGLRKMVIDNLNAIASADVTSDARVVTREQEIEITDAGGKPTGETKTVRFQSVEFTDTEDSPNRKAISSIGYDSNGRIKIGYYDKTKALELLGKFSGILGDKIEVSGPGGGPVEILTKAERRNRLADLLAKRSKNAGAGAD